MTEFEKQVLSALRGIERALKASVSPEEGIVTREPAQDHTGAQTGAQRLTGGAAWLYELPQAERERLKDLATTLLPEYSPRLVEKLLNPEDH